MNHGSGSLPNDTLTPPASAHGQRQNVPASQAPRATATRRRRIAITLCAATLWAAASCHRGEQAPPAPASLPVAPVRVLTLESRPLAATEEVVGTVQAKLRAVIEAKVSGRIAKMLAAPGQSVAPGELLAQLDAREIQARLDRAIATRDWAARDTERLRPLVAQNAVARLEFDTTEARFRIAVAEVAEAETMLEYTQITAPFAGVITRKLADVGDLAAPGRPLLELDAPAALRVETAVPESLIHQIELGAPIEVRSRVGGVPVRAQVSEIAPAADADSRTFNVKLDLPEGAGLRVGQFVRVSVPAGESNVLLAPTNALVRRGQMEMVFVVRDGKAELRLVKSGRRLGDAAELVSGVSGGEALVIEGAAELRDGQPVDLR